MTCRELKTKKCKDREKYTEMKKGEMRERERERERVSERERESESVRERDNKRVENQ